MSRYPLTWIVGLIMGLLVSACTGSRPAPSLFEALAKQGVQSIQLGDELKLVLPTHALFMACSAVLKAESYPLLNQVITLLNCKENWDIRVIAYVDEQHLPLANLMLSRQQALVIADYLVRHGLNTRVLHATSYATKTVKTAASSAYIGELDCNQRIEIITRLLHREDSQ